MQLLVLRARSSCALCGSRLPPRTEAWQDEASGAVTCLTCERMERQAVAAPTAPPPVQDAAPRPPEPLPMFSMTPPGAAPAEAAPGAVEPEGAVVGATDGELDDATDIDAEPRWSDGPPELDPDPDLDPDPGPGSGRRAGSEATPAPIEAPTAASAAADVPATTPEPVVAAPGPVDSLPLVAPPAEAEPLPTRRPVGRRPSPSAPSVDGQAPRRTLRPGGTPAPGRTRTPPPAEPAVARSITPPFPSPRPGPPRRRRDDVAPGTTPRRRHDDPPADAVAPDLPTTPDPAGPAPEGLVHPKRPEPEAPPSVPMHHPAPGAVTVDEVATPAGDGDVDPRRRESVTSLVGRLRPVNGPLDDLAERTDRVFDRVLDDPTGSSALDPSLALPLNRGDMGEGRVGQTLEAARIQGIEVLHGVRVAPALDPVDHLVVALNGVWVVRAVPVLAGKLERRDLGDWFNADPRLFIADEDHSEVVADVRGQVEATTALLAGDAFSDLPVRGVVCFGSIQPGWVSEPFVLDGVSITWRSRLVEPLLDPVLVDVRSRMALVHRLAASVTRPGPSTTTLSAVGPTAPGTDASHQAAG